MLTLSIIKPNPNYTPKKENLKTIIMPYPDKYNPVYDSIQPVSEPTSGVYSDAETFTIDQNLKFEGEGSYYSEEKGGIAVLETLADYRMVIGTDRTLYGMLKKNKDIFPNGPYCIDSRDDGVTIHNRNFNQPPKYIYTYRGGNGELLSCEIKTKKKEVAVQAEQSSSIDPLTKELNTTISQTCSNPEIDLIQQYRNSKKKPVSVEYLKNFVINPNSEKSDREEEEKQKYISSAKTETETKKELQANYQVTQQDILNFMTQARSEFKALYEQAKSTGDILPLVKANSMGKFVVKVKKPIKMVVYPGNYATVERTPGIPNYLAQYRSGLNYLRNDPNTVIIGYADKSANPITDEKLAELISRDPSYTPSLVIIQEKEVEVELDGARIMSSPLAMGMKDIQTSNDLSDRLQHTIEGDLTLIGRPGLVSSIILRLQNLSNRYSGDWYVTEVKHKINNSGYTCMVKLIKKGIPLVVSQITTKADTKSIYAELHKVASESLDAGILTQEKINQYFLEGIKDNPELEGKSLVLDLTTTNDEGNYPIHPASEDQVNITREREKYRLKNQ